MKFRKGHGEAGLLMLLALLMLGMLVYGGVDSYAEKYNALGNVDCSSNEIELNKDGKLFASYCLDYETHKYEVIQKLRSFDGSATTGQIDDVTPDLDHDEIEAILEKAVEEDGNVYQKTHYQWAYLEESSR